MLKKYIIKDLESLKGYLKTVSTPIFGVGARPYHATIGVRNIFPHFELLICKKTTKDAPLLEKEIQITYLNNNKKAFRNIENYKNYKAKKPSDLLKNVRIINYLNSFKKKPALLFFNPSPEIESLVKKQNYILVGNSSKMHTKYENKINFQNLVTELNLPAPKYIIIPAKELDYENLKNSIGGKFVIQFTDASVGSGTFFVKNRSDFSKILQNNTIKQALTNNILLKITRFIDCVYSPSMTVCVTKSGVLYTPLQKQILDAEEVIEKDRRSGVYCGHDWVSSNFSEDIQSKASQIATTIGMYFKNKEHFRGIFGIDFVLEKKTNCLYPIETNIRLLGSFPMISMLQENAKQPILQALQIIDALPLNNYELDIASLNKEMTTPKLGAQLNIHTKDTYPTYVSGEVNPGVYHINNKTKQVTYLKSGIFFEDLTSNNEILIAGSIPQKGRVYLRHQAICKIISRRSLLNNQGKLNDFAKIMVKYIYRNLALKKI